ncbi:Hypp2113 [Branchiostoma lanceolatum]|nr:Hypp2113 [Branchiostoma lanceolatum]
MYRMFVPRDYPEEDFLPGDVLVPMIPYKDNESQENVAVITTLRFNSLTGLQTVFVASIDSEGRVDIARTRACLKSVLTPVEGPEVQKREAIRDVHGFFLQGITPTAVTINLPNLRMRQEREPYDERYKVVQTFGEILDKKEVDDRTLLTKLRALSTTSDEQGGNGAPTQGGAFQNTSRTDDAMLEHEGHLSQQGQMRERASCATAGDGDICLEDHADPPVMRRAVERDLCAVAVLRHFKKTKATFGTHVRTCPLCQAKAGRLFHAAICRASNCRRCNRVAEGVARHMGRCDDHSCPIYGPICAAGIAIPLFVPGSFESTVVFVSLVRSVLAQILRFNLMNGY